MWKFCLKKQCGQIYTKVFDTEEEAQKEVCWAKKRELYKNADVWVEKVIEPDLSEQGQMRALIEKRTMFSFFILLFELYGI